jgi:1,4-dihydroxy-2-naphthoyl-CoA hydrolase
LLHGGVSCVLAETLGSVASQLVIDPRKSTAVGIEINASHLRGVREGHVVGRVSPIRIGKTLHVWDIRISDPAGRPVCISRLTVSVLGTGK